MPDNTLKSERSGASVLTRIRDFVLYILISLAVVVAIVLYAEYGPEAELSDFRWGALVCMALVTFGYPLKWYRSSWHAWQFWCAFGFLVVAHFTVYILALRRVEQFGVLWFAILNPLEWAVICPVLDWAGNASKKDWEPR
jgi:hypothetical protein